MRFLAGCLFVIVVSAVTGAVAADPEFVGVLALTEEKDVAAQLNLSDDQRQKLRDLIDRRESEVLELALSLKNATAEEREAKLAPFRKASETDGLKLLDDKQRALLEQHRLRRAGGASYAEPAVAKLLKLSPEQQQALAKILAERKTQLADASGQEQDVLRNAFDQRLRAVLEPEQRTAWDQLAGVSTPAAATVASSQPAQATTTAKVEPAKPKNPDDVKLKFNFRFQPWGDVLDWFAEQSDLSLLMDAPPPGTLNYTDSRTYTPAEALDLMNGVLLTKGYTLVRRDRMLHVVNLEDGIPPNLVAYVPAEKLDSLGEYELVTTLFPLENLSPEDTEAELKRLIGPQGSVVLLPRARQVQVTETAGRLRLMRSVLKASVGLQASSGGDIRAFQPVHVGVEDALPLLRQLLNIPADAYADADGSIRMAVDPLTGKLLVSGKPEKVAQFTEIMKAIDVPPPPSSSTVLETPQLEVYDVGTVDVGSALAVLQTLLANFSDVRLTTDPLTGKLIALAKPAQHATIRATLDQMQREARQFEVVRLQFVDPQLAVLSINRLFGGSGEAAAAGAPKVESDPVTRQLIIRGSQAQIGQIRELLSKMGESVADAGGTMKADTSTVRMLPLGSRTVRSALEQMEAVWPTLRPNKIRIISPNSGIPGVHPADKSRPPQTAPTPQGAAPSSAVPPATPPAAQPATPPKSDPAAKEKPPEQPVRVRTASMQKTTEQPATAAADEKNAPVAKGEPAPIIVSVGPTGIVIASDDVEALNEFEALLNSLASRSLAGGKEYTVFYLESASAVTAAEMLESVFGAGGGGGGGGSLMGDLASMALGNVGGGLVGAMMGGSSGGPAPSITASSSVMIVPDVRLNALIVHASPADLDLMEQLLQVIDRSDVPESTVNPKPRLIPVLNTGAAQIAEIIREVYQERMAGANRNRQPSPEEFMQMLRGGGGSRGGASSNTRNRQAEGQKISIGVDTRTNSLVVSASEPVFLEIEQLVKTLDHATTDSNQAIRIVTLKRSNPATVQKALTAIVGEKARTSDKPSSDGSGSRGDQSSQGGPGGGMPQIMSPDSRQIQDLMRQRMESFNQGRGGPSGGFGGGFPGRTFGGDGRSGGGDRGR